MLFATFRRAFHRSRLALNNEPTHPASSRRLEDTLAQIARDVAMTRFYTGFVTIQIFLAMSAYERNQK